MIMQYYISTISLVLIFNLSFGQSLQWVTSMGGNQPDAGWCIDIDSQKNVYTTGNFQASSDFDPGSGTFILSSFGSSDVFVTKQDSLGNLVWAKQIGGIYEDIAEGISLDDNGNIYLAGYMYGQVDFDPGPGVQNIVPSNTPEAFVLKLDSNGNFVWVRNIGYHAQHIEVDQFGNVYVTGLFSGIADFDPGPGIYNLTSAGQLDGFIWKLDSNGNLKMAISIGGLSTDWPESIAVDSSENSYICGGFYGTADFDPGPGVYNLISAGIGDVFIAKYDSIGNLIWAKSQSGLDSEGAFDLDVDKYGNVYATGRFIGTTNFDPLMSNFTMSTIGYEDIFITKFDSNGNFKWAKQIGSPLSDGGFTISTGKNNDLYVSGGFSSTADFDPGPGTYSLTSFGYQDIFICNLDSAGNLIFANHYGGINADFGYYLLIDDDSFYMTGIFASTGNFNTPASFNITSNGSFDIFVSKYSNQPLGLTHLSGSRISSVFPNPTKQDVVVYLPNIVVDGDIIVSDAFGRNVTTAKIIKSSTIDVSIIGTPGIYYVTIISDKIYQVFKLVKL
ncbi:MAG: SBBP repeat-containing protein [Bacteroidia bacterium]|nr:SBBP repeat-containing protein [Bacteroidia bacterium]